MHHYNKKYYSYFHKIDEFNKIIFILKKKIGFDFIAFFLFRSDNIFLSLIIPLILKVSSKFEVIYFVFIS